VANRLLFKCYGALRETTYFLSGSFNETKNLFSVEGRKSSKGYGALRETTYFLSGSYNETKNLLSVEGRKLSKCYGALREIRSKGGSLGVSGCWLLSLDPGSYH
jgi:hypothetical protein